MSYFLSPSERAELREEKQRYRDRNHWCRDCLGHTGPGSPCAPDDETELENNDDEDES